MQWSRVLDAHLAGKLSGPAWALVGHPSGGTRRTVKATIEHLTNAGLRQRTIAGDNFGKLVDVV